MGATEEVTECEDVLGTLLAESVLSLKGFVLEGIFVGVEGRDPEYWLPAGDEMYSFSTPELEPRLDPILSSLFSDPSLFLGRDFEFCFSASFSMFFRLSMTSLVGSMKSLLILSR